MSARSPGGHGADVILDMIGGDYVARNYAAAAEDGRIVQIGTQHGGTAEVPVGLLDGQAADPYRLDAPSPPGRLQGDGRASAP